MTEWMNNNQGWLSVLFLLLSIPLSILGNVITPKFQLWSASRSKESLDKQIERAEKMISLVDRMIAEPSFAIARFTNTLLRAVMGYVGISLFITWSFFIISNPNIFLSPPPKDLPYAEAAPTVINVILFIPIFILTLTTSGKTIELYAMTYWIEENEKWKQEKIKEVEKLKKQLSKFAT